MPAAVKFIIGLIAVLLMTWIHHGPLGRGEALVSGLEAQAREAVAAGEVPGVEVGLGRDPLSRVATLSGPANDIQREGMGQYPGLNDRVRDIEGISGVRWAGGPDQGNRVLPLLLETLLATALAYLIGLGIGWVLFGRAKRESYV